LWLAQHVAPTIAAAILVSICVVCAVPAIFIHEEPMKTAYSGAAVAPPMLVRLGRAGVDAIKDVWRTIRSRAGWTGLLICCTPVGTGAATQLFSAVAPDYHAGEWDVEFVNGIFGGIVSAIGCLAGGYMADRVNRRLLYVLAGAATAVCAVVMAIAPVDGTFTVSFGGWSHAFPTTFTIGCLTYSFANGVGYAAFAAFVLEMIGHGAGVTSKYQLFVAASNQAISYVTVIDGLGYDFGRKRWAHAAWGGRVGLLGTDALATAVGIVVITTVMLTLRRRRPLVIDGDAPPAFAPVTAPVTAKITPEDV
jgi:hypothetical protein